MDESNTTYEVTIVPPGWSHNFAKSGNLMVLILLPNVFFLMKNHHDVSFHQMFIYFCFFFDFLIIFLQNVDQQVPVWPWYATLMLV